VLNAAPEAAHALWCCALHLKGARAPLLLLRLLCKYGCIKETGLGASKSLFGGHGVRPRKWARWALREALQGTLGCCPEEAVAGISDADERVGCTGGGVTQ
jgi:hypothetical protein